MNKQNPIKPSEAFNKYCWDTRQALIDKGILCRTINMIPDAKSLTGITGCEKCKDKWMDRRCNLKRGKKRGKK